MTTVTVHQAKTHFSRLINRVLAGEDVVVMRGREPVVSLKPVARLARKRRVGGLRGMITHMSEDFDKPLHDFKEYMS